MRLVLAPLVFVLTFACNEVVVPEPPADTEEAVSAPSRVRSQDREAVWQEYCACWIPPHVSFCLAREDNFGCYAESITMERLHALTECRCALSGTLDSFGESACLDELLEGIDDSPEYLAFKQACHDSGCADKLGCESGRHRGFTASGYEAMSACFETAATSETCADLAHCVGGLILGCGGPP